MYSFVDYLCAQTGLNPQPWHIGVMLQPAELPTQFSPLKLVVLFTVQGSL